MRKLFLPLFVLFPFWAIAQTPIPNGGMENWQNVGSSTEEPTEWNSNKTGTGFATWGPQTLYRESTAANVHSGTYAARIQTGSYLGTPVNGVMTLGRVNAPTTTPSDGYNNTLQSDPNFSEAIVSQPDTLVFWAKYVPSDGTDSARVSAFVHDAYDLRDPPNSASLPHIRSSAIKNFRTGGVYVRMAIPFTMVNTGVSAQYILISLTSSKTPGVGTSGTKLYVDDIALIYNPTLTTGTINPTTYYVSTSAGTSISVPFTATGTYNAGNVFTAQLSDASGSFASPVVLGTLSGTTSGTINGTIPAGTPSGSGYRVRIVSSNYPVTAAPNSADITINLVSNSIAPTATQTIEANVAGAPLSVSESTTPTSRAWRYATVSGGPYSGFTPAETGSTYIPLSPSAGTFYIVCESTFPGGLVATSNEVIINVVDNAVTPSATQSILIGQNGNLLTVTETPSGTSREWLVATVSGGPYSSFAPIETGMTYLPNFASSGTYYVICQSIISGVIVTSNEVVITVDNITLSTGTISGPPFEFSPSAPNAAVNVPYTVGGSGSFGGGNVFTAELSDATGSFASPVVIGSVSSTTSGTINASIPSTTPAGNGYRIRVVASSPAISGSDNGSDLIIDQYNNQIAPAGVQNFTVSSNGSLLTVTESQSTTVREWRYSTTSGGPYNSFVPVETGNSYTPSFATLGTFYVVCASTNQYADEVLSNEVECNVINSTTLTTTTITGTPFYVSPNAIANGSVSFTTDVVYGATNVFSAELSDENGSFASPVVIGTLSATASGNIPVTIPNNSYSGTNYKIRVVSSDPALTGTVGVASQTIVQFEVSATPLDTQYIASSFNGSPISATSTHPGATYTWVYKTLPNNPWLDFSPAETNTSYTPFFTTAGGRYVACMIVNVWNDTLYTPETVIIVSNSGVGIEDENIAKVTGYLSNDQWIINLTSLSATPTLIEVINQSGQVIVSREVMGGVLQALQTPYASGIYHIRIIHGAESYHLRLLKP